MLALAELYEFAMPPTAWMFGCAGREHMDKYGPTAEQFAKVAEKNCRHSANNPHAQFQKVYTLQAIQGSPMISDPVTKLLRSWPASSSSRRAGCRPRRSRSPARPW